MKHLLATTLLILLFQISSGQTNYLAKGNAHLDEEKYDMAEQTFRDAINSDPDNLVFQCQLALALMSQEKHAEAQKLIDKVLSKERNNVAALWYGGMNSFLDKIGDLRKSVEFFERALPLLDKNEGQYYSANWFIGRSYQILLQTDGLTYQETNRMLECYTTYLKLQPDADDAAKIAAFVQYVKERRPGDNVKKWVNKS